MMYCKIIVEYDPKKMPPTSLKFLEKDLREYCKKFNPVIPVILRKESGKTNGSWRALRTIWFSP